MSYIKSGVFLFLVFVIFFLTQCKTVDKKTVNAEKVKDEMYLIQPMVNKNSVIKKMNSDKSMQLVLEKFSKVGDPAFHFQYTVYDVVTKEIIKKDFFRGTGIEWNDNTSLKLIPYVGMEQKPTSENPEEILSSQIQTQTQIIKLKG